ncbi:hypothetical protein BVI2075_310032 [Burkholderia vietnamiensis]|nr:hypothetical protein BVI2075_310032 [Burkholderia vietnamiensis]CAG9221666.1 hypothetical protein BVI1335_40002 [Burkholderia vietnamiensis]
MCTQRRQCSDPIDRCKPQNDADVRAALDANLENDRAAHGATSGHAEDPRQHVPARASRPLRRRSQAQRA